MKINHWEAFILGYLVGISIIIGWTQYYAYASYKEKDCQKTSTQMIEISGVKKDFLICESPIYIIKSY